MAKQKTATSPPVEAPRSAADEQRLARAFAVGLPLLTIAGAAIVGVIIGPATSILVLAAGLLLAVIAILWGSLRILSGDVPLSAELETLDMEAQGIDALSSRKKMLLRALKDLENERGIGKIEDDDFDQLAQTYRVELKALMKRIDETLAPHRTKAEEAARAYLVKAGLAESGYRGEVSTKTATEPKRSRVVCPKCDASNEPDAKFCKECATSLKATSESAATAAEEVTTDD